MRNWILILILFSILMQSFSREGIYISFKINQDYIARVLCVNKNKPMLNCNGKCYLAKKLKQAEQREQKKVLLKTLEFNLWCEACYSLAFPPQISLLFVGSSFYLEKAPLASNMSIFHPPQL